MASSAEIASGRMPAPTTMQNAASALGNGTSLNVTGATRTILFVTIGGTVTGGVLTFEESKDGGTEWANATDVQDITVADGGATITTLAATAAPAVVKIGTKTGPRLIRARISTALTGTAPTITVRAVPIGT